MEDYYFGFIYITTDLENGKRYIGKCQISNYDNDWKTYLGSGTELLEAIKLKGKENFHREIVYLAKSDEELKKMEDTFIRNHNAVKSNDYYNRFYGGFGGRCGVYNEERNRKISETRKKQNICWNRGKTGIYSKETLEKIADGAIKHYVKVHEPNGNIGYVKGVTEAMQKYGLTYNLFYIMLRQNKPYKLSIGNRSKIAPNFVGYRLEKITKEQYLEETSTTSR